MGRTVTDGESLHPGDLELTTHVAPGHTKGNTTWAWTSCDDKRCLHMVDVGSLSALDFQIINNPKYPGIVNNFEHNFAKVAGLPCDIALGPHPGIVHFWARVAKRKQGDADALIAPTACRDYAIASREWGRTCCHRRRKHLGPAPTSTAMIRVASDDRRGSIKLFGQHQPYQHVR